MSKLRGVLWDAYSSEVGLVIVTTDTEVFKRKFYSERAKAREEGIFEFDTLQLVSPPPDVINRLWIVRTHGGTQQVHSPKEGEASQEVPAPV